MVYFPPEIFKNIMSFVGDNLKEENKKLWCRITVKRSVVPSADNQPGMAVHIEAYDQEEYEEMVDEYELDDDNFHTAMIKKIYHMEDFKVLGYNLYEERIDWRETSLLKPICMVGLRNVGYLRDHKVDIY